MIRDRYEPMSREDYLCAGLSVREAREILDRLTREQELRQQELEDDLAHEEERIAAEDT